MTEMSRFAKVVQMGRAARLARRLSALERAPAAERLAAREQRVRETIRHAARHSPLYRDHWGPGAEKAALHELAPMTKDLAMERFEDWVTDPRLRLDELRAHVEQVRGDERYLGAYRVMTTGGSSRLPGVFVYDQRGWEAVLSTSIRGTRMNGDRPRPGRRVAWVGAPTARHMARRFVEAMDVGLFRTLRLSATDPIERVVEALNRFQPEVMSAYPSMGALLAVEQLEGRLRIAPETVMTSSEPCTPAMTERMQAAWGVKPADLYAMTETGPVAGSCERRDGLHLWDDLAVVEVMDADGDPVPAGTPGAKVYVTNVFNRVQPIVRMEVSDVLCLDPEPCPCGRTLPLMRPVEGRTDDVLELAGPDGRPVAVHPVAFAPVGADADVCDWELAHREDGIALRAALRRGADPRAATGRLERTVAGILLGAGAVPPPITVSVVDTLPRDPSRAGKRKLVRSETAAAPAGVAG